LALIVALCACKKDIKTQARFTTKLRDKVHTNFEIKGVSCVAMIKEINDCRS